MSDKQKCMELESSRHFAEVLRSRVTVPRAVVLSLCCGGVLAENNTAQLIGSGHWYMTEPNLHQNQRIIAEKRSRACQLPWKRSAYIIEESARQARLREFSKVGRGAPATVAAISLQIPEVQPWKNLEPSKVGSLLLYVHLGIVPVEPSVHNGI